MRNLYPLQPAGRPLRVHGPDGEGIGAQPPLHLIYMVKVGAYFLLV